MSNNDFIPRLKLPKTAIRLGLLVFVLSVAFIPLYLAPQFIVRMRISSTPNQVEYKLPFVYTQSFRVKSFDGTQLAATIIYPEIGKSKKATLIALHGIRSRKESMLPLVNDALKNGYNVVLMDHRAHGNSDGTYCTYGFKEKKDVTALHNYLKNEMGIKHPIGLWGRSLGAAVGLQAMAYDSTLAFGIFESPFKDFRTIEHDYFERITGYRLETVNKMFVALAELYADFNADEVSPLKAALKIKQPVIISHGKLDRKISHQYGEQVFANLAGPKHFISVENGNHVNHWQAAGEGYFKDVFFRLDSLTAIEYSK